MSYIVRKEFKFCYAHQLFKSYTALCHETIHGHNAKVEVFLESNDLDETGMVVDFGKMRDNFKSYFDNILDHSLILPKMLPEVYIESLSKFNKRIYLVPENPTAEYLSKIIFEYLESQIVHHLKIKNVFIKKVRFWETDSAYAEYKRG